ncbi:MAG: YkgJ family cysteine cluster protein [Sediminibacterium sp.]|jgi:uncharacterized protein
MMQVNMRSFKQKVRHNQKSFKSYLGKIKKNPPLQLDAIAAKISNEVWQEVDCLSCANCCKSMTPTFTTADIKRIATHLEMSIPEFKDKWLDFDSKDWVNKKQPCQFLNMSSNMCSIYEYRPADCGGFPYLKKKKMVEYMHVHQQNINHCPATYKMVEKMMEQGVKAVKSK